MKGMVACLQGLLLAGIVSVQAQAAVTPFFRLYLVDGTEVTTYGEFARLDDQVVAAVPIGPVGAGVPDLQTVTIAADRVDWPRTNAYLQVVRLAQYTASTAERDYAAFTDDVAATLDRVSSTPDPLARIDIIQQARARLVDWPRQHFGYRQQDADAMLTVLDEVLAGLRAAAGQQHFSLALASGTVAPPPPALRPAPSLREVITQALALSRHLDDPAERVRLLGRVRGLLEPAGGSDRRAEPGWDRRWARQTRRTVRRLLDAERKASHVYASLRDRALDRAAALLRKADVRSLMTLRADTIRRDERLGRQRPGEMAALIAQLDAQLAAAQQLRLARDRWEQRRPLVDAYVRKTSAFLAALPPIQRALDDIRTLSGPPIADLDRADGVLAGAQVRLQQSEAPEEAADVQALATAALQMASSATRARRAATLAGDLSKAWEASAAAAGALMTLERVRDNLSRLADEPRPSIGGGPLR